MKLFKMFFFLCAIGCTGWVPPANYYPSAGNYPPPPPNNYQGNNNYPDNNNQQPAPSPRSDREYDTRKRQDPERREVINDSRLRRRGTDCEAEERNHECKKLCREMYKRRADRDDCEELTVNQIDALMDVYEALESTTDLTSIVLSDLKVFFKVSIAGFDYLAREYKRSEVKDILKWIVEDPEVTEFFVDEDGEGYETLETLLQRLSSYDTNSIGNNSLIRPFTADIDLKRTILEVAVEADNEDAVEWLMDYIFKEHNHCENKLTRNCWGVICKIGNEFEEDYNREDLLEISPFEDYVSKIMEDGINAVPGPGRTAPNSDPEPSGKSYWCNATATHEDCIKPQATGAEVNRRLRDIDDVIEQPVDYKPGPGKTRDHPTWIWCDGEWVRALCGGFGINVHDTHRCR